MSRPLLVLPAVFLASSVLAAPQNYAIDSLHSFPSFAVSHLGMSTIQGRFDKMTGRIVLDEAAKSGSLEVRIAATTVSSGDSRRSDGTRSRDEHLRGSDFFNSAEFPELIYKSTRFVFKGDAIESIEGNLTLLGVTRPLKLSVTAFKCGSHPFTKKPMCGADAVGTVKRTDFGMKFGVPAIADDVKLSINVEAYPE